MKLKKTLLYSLLLAFPLGAWAQFPCLPEAEDCCSEYCFSQTTPEALESCLCDCLLEQALTLREAEQYDPAIAKLRAVAALCPEREAEAIIDSIYQAHRIWVYQSGKSAVATPLGKVLSPFQFDDPQPFTQGMAIAEVNEKLFFIGKEGELLTPRPGYEAIIPAAGNLYYCIRGRSGPEEQGITTHNSPRPFFWRSYSDGFPDSLFHFCPHCREDSTLSRLASKIAEKGYEDAGDFSQGRARVQKGRLWGFIDSTGAVIAEPQYEYAGDFSQGRARVQKGGLWGFIDSAGAIIAEPQYEGAGDFSHGRARVKKGGLWGFIGSAGAVIAEPQYEYAGDFSQGRARVQKGGLLRFIDLDGQKQIKSNIGCTEIR